MACGKNSKARKLEDRRQAKSAAYRSEVNPFQEGTRLWRYFVAARRHVNNMNALEW
jgi:hypothetical protein